MGVGKFWGWIDELFPYPVIRLFCQTTIIQAELRNFKLRKVHLKRGSY
ncbi:hypothetical protein SAMN04487963_2769 [Marinobacter zhejiangensis]|uniref:Uncharacterized protein n=1 Tax=Marinobacter zhejiangensis TaxID=488535 RepID=A0A1I4RHN3_9GAMM|nr:hypothetical protein SAMN04487963_2769 [Marinobacter zhejiangensis]